ncbi:NAC transcription factor 32-like [Corylus avellana]|uniref:NAC transcription factor 32-like n=1 Tax=Corylus avellana TaxID=13451 RepID=UPI00286D6442|nr:NAC transcription factor 32-like [Corylus avellana]XP_059430202.1 NAC transcription factor 32-like [Corylus avellana]
MEAVKPDVTHNCDHYFKTLPPGYRFRPTEEELINCYLNPKLLNQPLPRSQIIEAKIYDFHPDILTGMYQEIYTDKENGVHEWYFFTPRERKYPNGERPNRTTGDGYWKATGSDKPIEDTRNILIGFKKTLVFYQGKAPGGVKSNWIMHEFRTANPPLRKRKYENDMTALS